jgi:hypothetical protein
MKTLSVIIVNYKSEQFLENCLASLYSKYTPDVEIIIINNDATTKLPEIAITFPQAKIINNQKNIGFGSAHNQGAKKAQGKYLFLLNPDTTVQTGIEKALIFLENNPEVAIIGSNLVSLDKQTQSWIAGVSVCLSDLLKNNFGLIASKKIWQSKTKIEADWVSGGAMFVRKNIFEKVGGFDENFFMYFEDIDLCKRIQKLGNKIFYHPEIKIQHIGGASFSNKKEQKKEYYKSQDYFFQKHFGTNKMKLLRLIRKLCFLN